MGNSYRNEDINYSYLLLNKLRSETQTWRIFPGLLAFHLLQAYRDYVTHFIMLIEAVYLFLKLVVEIEDLQLVKLIRWDLNHLSCLWIHWSLIHRQSPVDCIPNSCTIDIDCP